MRVLFTGDIHMTDKPDDAYRFRLFGAIEQYIVHHDIDALFILGDLTEAKDRHTGELINKLMDEFAYLAQITNVYVLRGNHDYTNPRYPTFKVLRHIPNLEYIDTPTEIELQDGTTTLMLPNSPTPTSDWENLDFSQYDFICMHQTVSGSKAANGYALEGLSMKLFQKAKKVYSGDIHVPQTLGKVTYIGAPYHTDFGDTYTPRLLLLDTGTKKETDLNFETVKKLSVHVNKIEELAKLEDSIAPEDQIAIVYYLDLKEIDNWDTIQKSVEQWCARNELDLKSLRCEIEQPLISGGAFEGPEIKDPKELLEKFISTKYPTLPKPYIEAGKSLIQEVDNIP